MNLTERRKRRLRDAFDTLWVGDIATEAAHIAAKLSKVLKRLIQRARFDIGEHHLHTGLRERFGHRKADARRRARDESRLTLELTHQIPLTNFEFR